MGPRTNIKGISLSLAWGSQIVMFRYFLADFLCVLTYYCSSFCQLLRVMTRDDIL